MNYPLSGTIFVAHYRICCPLPDTNADSEAWRGRIGLTALARVILVRRCIFDDDARFRSSVSLNLAQLLPRKMGKIQLYQFQAAERLPDNFNFTERQLFSRMFEIIINDFGARRLRSPQQLQTSLSNESRMA